MKFLGAIPGGVALDLDAADCLALADAIAYARSRDIGCNWEHLGALGAALDACALVAASDTLHDTETPEAEMVARAREVWGPIDTHSTPYRRLTEREGRRG